MRKLVAAAVCLLSLSPIERDHRKKMYKGIKCCEQQLRRVDKALSRAKDIAVGSWIYLSHRNLILAEDKRLCGERLYAVFNEVGKMSVIEYKSGTNWCNKCSILADKEFASHPENKEKHTKENCVFRNFNSLSSFKHNNNLF